jgi:hypothetical protein
MNINQRLNDKEPGALPPFCNFRGRKLDTAIDFRIDFGEYVQVHEDNGLHQNDMIDRTTGALAMCPTGNLSGSVKFLSLATGQIITRDKWTVVPMPQDVIQRINGAVAKEGGPIPKDPVFQYRDKVVKDLVIDEPVPEPEQHLTRDPELIQELEPAEVVFGNPMDESEMPTSNSGVHDGTDAAAINADATVDVSEPVVRFQEDLESISGGNGYTLRPSESDEQSDSGSEDDSLENENAIESESSATENVRPMRSRVARDYGALNSRGTTGGDPLPKPGTRGGVAYFTRALKSKLSGSLQAFHITVREALKKMPKPAINSMVKEVINVWGNGRNMTPIRFRDLTLKQKKSIIGSSLFLKEKRLPTGVFEKLKSRLVALGNMQDSSVYTKDDTGSPTVSLLSLFTLATVGHGEGRVFKSVDIPGAYLHADIGEKEVLVLLDPLIATILAKYAPEVKPFMNEKGELVVKLNSALYGCVESAKRWYLEISSYLESIGFEKNKLDICVFNKKDAEGNQITVAIHVDDLLFMCKSEESINEVIEKLRGKYGDVSIHEGAQIPYLGMVFDFSRPDKELISMHKYVKVLLELYEVTGKAKTPTDGNLFSIDASSPLLSEELSDMFHSRVAKLLYLAKRVRPEILPSVIFLTSRVRSPTDQDWRKLDRVLRYLNANPELGIGLSVKSPMTVIGYVDASFAVHFDFRSHTGAVVTLGDGPISVDSSRQKLNTKSTMESEIVGASDGSNNIFYLRNFLIEQGYRMGPAKLYQDNQSTLAILKTGQMSKRSRHINIRYFYLKDRVDQGELELEYIPTDEMLADLLTKPLQGEKFRMLRDRILNWN